MRNRLSGAPKFKCRLNYRPSGARFQAHRLSGARIIFVIRGTINGCSCGKGLLKIAMYIYAKGCVLHGVTSPVVLA